MHRIQFACWLALLPLFLNSGCSQQETPTLPEKHGPHGGHLFHLPADTDFDLEFTLDHQRRTLVVYVQELGSRTPFPLPVDSLDAVIESSGKKFRITLLAQPRAIDPHGSSSRFSVSKDELPQQLIGSNQFRIVLSFNRDKASKIEAFLDHRNDHTHNYDHE